MTTQDAADLMSWPPCPLQLPEGIRLKMHGGEIINVPRFLSLHVSRLDSPSPLLARLSREALDEFISLISQPSTIHNMKKGSYRFIIQRTTEVLITVDDPVTFEASRLLWQPANPDNNYLSSIAVLIERDEAPVTPGARCKVDVQDMVLEQVRTCRHCGYTEYDACRLSTGPCQWLAEDLCSNPFCVAARQAEVEKEVANG